jgi:uncharacterized protein YbcC (UPF0753/DUF2309 family)
MDRDPINLSLVVEEVLKSIPMVWPIQQFIATNPLWDLTDSPVNKINDIIGDVSMTLPLSEYWRYYQTGKISPAAISQAISEFVVGIEDKAVLAGSTLLTTDTVTHQLLYTFMTSLPCQQALIQQFEHCQHTDNHALYYIVSSQIQHYFPYHNIVEIIKTECFNWLASYLNPTDFHSHLFQLIKKVGVTQYKDKNKGENDSNFFNFWRKIMLHKNRAWRKFLLAYPDDVERLVEKMVTYLAIPDVMIHNYIFEICWQLKGWMGYVKWHKIHATQPYVNQFINPIEIIAIWLTYEVFWLDKHKKKLAKFSPRYDQYQNNQYDSSIKTLWNNHVYASKISTGKSDINEEEGVMPQVWRPSKQDLLWLWQHAYELSYQQPLYQRLLEEKKRCQAETMLGQHSENQTLAQWVFCIDVRSEGLRRYLEQIGQYETFGVAGFFGFAHQLYDETHAKLTFQCPALIKPDRLVHLIHSRNRWSRQVEKSVVKSMQKSRKSFLSAFALYEIVGFWCALALVFNNYGKKMLLGRFKQDNHSAHLALAKNDLSIENKNIKTIIGSAHNLLQGMGLTNNFAKFIIICSHAATTTNNPYSAALDCGACGGNAGVSNARLAANFLNRKCFQL